MSDVKLLSSNTEYWSEVLIALAQVTFGVAWATIFLPFDAFKMFMIVLNVVITFAFLTIGARIRRKK